LIGKFLLKNIMNSTNKIKIAVVHDDFIQFGGAEKLILEIAKDLKSEIDFEVEIFSSLISDRWKKILKEKDIKFTESFLSKIPFCYQISKVFFLSDLFYLSFQSFNFDRFDIVFSSSTRFGHCVLTKPRTFHISYINSPARALWDERKYFWGKKFLYLVFKNFLPQKRIIDFYSQNFADLIISNSKNIKNKVLKNYKLNSIVLYPFVKEFQLPYSNSKQKYFVLISRLVSWKKIDFVIEAFNSLDLNLKIIGTGPELIPLKSKSKNNIEFLGYVSENEKFELLSKATGLIFPQNEDFGLTLVESLLVGTPVIYFNKGGAKEILNSKLGTCFNSQDMNSLINSLKLHQEKQFDPNFLRSYGLKFTEKSFTRFIKKLIKSRV